MNAGIALTLCGGLGLFLFGMSIMSNSIEAFAGDKLRGIGNILFESMIPYLSIMKLSYAKNIFKIRLNKKENWIVTLKNLLVTLNEIIHKKW